MIPDAITAMVTYLLGGLFDLLPTSSLNLYGPYEGRGWQNAASYMGSKLIPFNVVIPFGDILTMSANLTTIIFPIFTTYMFLNWTYRHIPQIGGFGPGSG